MHFRSEEEFRIFKQVRENAGKSTLELERDFQRQFTRAADMTHWLNYHTVNSKKSRRGFPDSVLVKGSTLLFAELKVPPNDLSPEQKVWIQALSRVERVEVHVWTPDDREEISKRLARAY